MLTNRWRRAAALFGLLAAALVAAMVSAGPALADDGGISPTDSHGISILDYVQSWDTGAGSVLGVAVTPGTTMPAGFLSLAFGAFTAMGWLWATVYKLFVKLDWLGPLVNVADKVSTSITRQFGESFVIYIVGATLLLTVVVFALRNMRGRAWHHVAITVVIMGIGTAITLPVGEAAHLLKQGRDIAVQTGGVATGGQVNTDPTAPLVDKFIREPAQRWQYGHDLDSLGCGQAWDDALRAIKSGVMDAEKIKDVPLQCPGGTLGSQMHAYTMNPGGAVYSGFLNPLFMALVTFLVLAVVVHIAGTAVGALIHAALIKPGLIAVGTSAGQSFLARNVIDGYTAAMATCGYLLVLFIAGSLTAAVAASAGSSQEAMLVTTVIMVGAIFGVRKVSKNLHRWKARSATTILPNGAPDAYGPPTRAPEKARRLAMQTAQQATTSRRNKALVNAVSNKGAAKAAKVVAEGAADALAPEVMIPAAAAGVAAQHILHAAHNYRSQNAATYQGGGGRGSAWGAIPAGGGKGGGVAGSRGRPGARAVNYSGGGSAAAGGATAAARAVAGRSRQKRAAETTSATNGTSRRATNAAGRQPRANAPLRTAGATVGPSADSRAPVWASAPAPVNTSAPGGMQRAAQNGGSWRAPSGAPTGGPAAPAAAARTGTPVAPTRSQSVSTARNAARNYRSRKS